MTVVAGLTGLRIATEIASAVAAGGPVVALESTIVAHGLPFPDNLEVARACEAAVRAAGALPATVAVVAASSSARSRSVSSSAPSRSIWRATPATK